MHAKRMQYLGSSLGGVALVCVSVTRLTDVGIEIKTDNFTQVTGLAFTQYCDRPNNTFK